MLQRLKIKNIALIKDLEIEFDKGLNVLFGETGAGKSIIIDSINFLLGERADKTLIRNSETFSKVEGVFFEWNNEELKAVLTHYGIEYSGELIISRLMNRDNYRSDIRVNGNMVTLSMLREITSCLCDICSQNENQYLLNTKNQLNILDSFCSDDEILNLYKKYLAEYNGINEKLKSFGGSEEERNKEIDFLKFQICEISDAGLVEGEEETLKEEVKKLSNIEKISNSVDLATQYMQNQQGIVELFNSVIRELVTVSKYDSGISEILTRLQSSKLEIDDINYELTQYADTLEYDPQKFYLLDSRLDLIKRLQRKYGKTTKDILDYYELMQQKLEKLQNSEEEIQKLEDSKQKILNKLYEVGVEISNIRKEKAKELEKTIIKELENINMKNTKFSIYFKDFGSRENVEKNIHSNGLDEIEFLFSANAGQPVLPLNKIISGGEMSRFMLATKSVLAECDNIPVLIFDEIDTGISGKTSIEVAKKMARISKSHQVLVVTHSFQVVAMSDSAIYISKKQVEEDETITQTKKLSENQIIDSISQMLGTDETLVTARNQATELRQWTIKYKAELKNSVQ